MGKPAARVGDMHTCPMVDPGPKPHVGGPIMPPGCPTVFIGGMPAARVGDMATCVGPPDSIAMGSTGVFIGGKPAALVSAYKTPDEDCIKIARAVREYVARKQYEMPEGITLQVWSDTS